MNDISTEQILIAGLCVCLIVACVYFYVQDIGNDRVMECEHNTFMYSGNENKNPTVKRREKVRVERCDDGGCSYHTEYEWETLLSNEDYDYVLGACENQDY